VGTVILSRHVKSPGFKVDHLLPSSAEVENGWNDTSALTACLMYGVGRDSFTFAVTGKIAVVGHHLSSCFGSPKFRYFFGYQLLSVKFYRLLSAPPGDGTLN
jgi:hypothetical protein